ncbi:DUF2478 domain-containing protein [Rhodovulum sp. FJ3]|uniref:DUF2478 domain-containing protein n=1 Tax=Rhodovulum sp. FJ3 TaxID=3079053 RepID=UPI00293DC234|nr:DUF2478 domain-containing protein [Rhodovulum sp. FJ3]MDV4169619.1 DUF2478 domain-containing protein [Rhodovulum sp. FJ3]
MSQIAQTRLGYVLPDTRGGADTMLSALAARLQSEGRVVAGLVQCRAPEGSDHPCDMDLAVLPSGPRIAIAQKLGIGSRGCRLDPASLEAASIAVCHALEAGAEALIINKFGAQECQGRGLCDSIALAMSRGIPVLTSVNRLNHDGFVQFAGGLATRLDLREDVLHDWLSAPVPA